MTVEKISFLDKNKIRERKKFFCDKVIIVLAFLIRKCAYKDEFEVHLRKSEEDRQKSQKLDDIYSKKEVLFDAVKRVEFEKKDCFETHKIIADSLKKVEDFIVNNEYEKALSIVRYLNKFYKDEMKIHLK